MDISPGAPASWGVGEKLEGVDAVIPRVGASVTQCGLAVIRQFEMTGVYCLTESVALGRSRDKLRALQLLSRKGLGLPRTSFAYRVHNKIGRASCRERVETTVAEGSLSERTEDTGR